MHMTPIHAFGVDWDPEVLAWGRRNNLGALPERQRARVHLIEQDVMTTRTRPLDLVLAMNFSYWLLAGRDALRAYFQLVRDALAPEGVFMLDAYGVMTPATSISASRTVRGWSVPSPTSGGCGHCLRSASCWRRPDSRGSWSTGRAGTPTDGPMAASSRCRSPHRMPAGSPTCPPSPEARGGRGGSRRWPPRRSGPGAAGGRRRVGRRPWPPR